MGTVNNCPKQNFAYKLTLCIIHIMIGNKLVLISTINSHYI